jgi:hypothetical protein
MLNVIKPIQQTQIVVDLNEEYLNKSKGTIFF